MAFSDGQSSVLLENVKKLITTKVKGKQKKTGRNIRQPFIQKYVKR